jgi:hypothetical protein
MMLESATAIQAELNEGEQLLWSGQPRQGIRFTRSEVYLLPYSLIISGLFLAFSVLVNLLGLVYIGVLISLPLFLISLYFLLGRFLLIKNTGRPYIMA